MQCLFKAINGLMSESLFPWGQAVGGEGWEGTEQAPVSPNSSSVSERCVSKKLSWDQKCSLTLVPPALHGVKPVTAALVLQGKPLSGGHSLYPIPSPTEPPKPQFFTFTFLLGLKTQQQETNLQPMVLVPRSFLHLLGFILSHLLSLF